MKSETFHNIASGFNAIIVSIALGMSGYWAIYTFDVLGQQEKAEAELEQIKKSIRGEASIIISMKGKKLSRLRDDHHVVEILLSISNKGTKSTHIDWTKASLFIRKVEFLDDEVSPTHGTRSSIPLQSEVFMVGKSVIRPGQKATLPLLTKVKDSGLYYLEYSVPIPTKQQESAVNAGVSESVVQEGKWVSREYIVIK